MTALERLKNLREEAEVNGYDNDLIGEPLLECLDEIIVIVEAATKGYAEEIRRHGNDPIACACIGGTFDDARCPCAKEYPYGWAFAKPLEALEAKLDEAMHWFSR